MDLVVDANVLFASLIKEGITSDLLFVDDFHLYAPEFLMAEFVKHRERIIRKTHRIEGDFKRFLDIIKRRIVFITRDEIEPFISQAERISPDIKDIPYLAVALRMNCAIWSNDSRLRIQDKIPIYSTNDLLKYAER